MESALRIPGDLRVIETFRLGGVGPVRYDRHLARMGGTADRLGLAFDAGEARRMIDAARSPAPRRARLTLGQDGLELTTTALASVVPVWRLVWARERIDSGDPWRSMKTTERAPYDRARADLGAGEEAIFLNEHGRIAEGAITSIFVMVADRLATPPIAEGALPGILRAELLATGRAVERPLRPDDLAGRRIYVGNALRGLIPAVFP